AYSDPADGATGVPEDIRIVLRFTAPLRAATANGATLVLAGPAGPVPVGIVAAEQGRLVFLSPDTPLAPGTQYVVTLTGVVGEDGSPVRAGRFTFTTREAEREPEPVEADLESWRPDGEGWRSGRPESPWRTLAPLLAPEGTTAVSGQVLRLDGRPLADVTLEMEGRTARTDRTGRFLLVLPGQPSEWCELRIDGRSASRGPRTYGIFEVGLQVTGGRTTVLPYTVWMPRLDTAHAVAIPSPTTSEVVVTTPYIPGLELHVPPGTVIRDHDGQVVRELSITAIPVDRPPFPLAKNVDVPVYFTIQPGGAYVHTYGASKGAWLVYPNYAGEYPGKRVQFFHYDTDPRSWYVYG
ncbi:MAG: Ig-like domain-containing protein, partial [Nocardioidaceae bacterium]